MPSVQRVGDQDSAGGVIIKGDSTVFVNGRPIAVEGESVTPHPCCGARGCPPLHCNAQTRATSNTIYVNGKRLVLTGDVDTCGHPRTGGSADVYSA
jgi:uncharacterized Zn-binding protein involved in type VI secretion